MAATDKHKYEGEMRLLVILYICMSIGFAIGCLKTHDVTTGLRILGASVLAIMAGFGLRECLAGVRVQKIVGPMISAALLALAGWLSMAVALNLAGRRYPGWLWVAIGFVACFLYPFVNRAAGNSQKSSA